MLGGVDIRRFHGGALVLHQAADCSKTRLHQSSVVGENDIDVRPDVGRAYLYQSDRRPERERGRRRGRALPEGGALRTDGGGSLDPESAVDHARAGQLRRKISQIVRRAYQAAPAPATVPKVLSRRRLAPGLGIVGEAFRRESVLG